MMTPDTQSRRRVVGTLDHVGLWAFTLGAAAVIIGYGWKLVVTCGSLLGIRPSAGSFIKQIVADGFPPIIDEKTGTVMILGSKTQWFGSENPSSTFVQFSLWAMVASTLVVLVIAVMVLLLCLSTLRGRPFGRTITWFVAGAGLVLIIGSTISQLLQAFERIAMVDAVKYLGPPNHIRVAEPPVNFDLAPIAIGVVLVVIAAAFKIGQRMQRDTEGLV